MATWQTHGVRPRCCPFCGQGINFDGDELVAASHYREGDHEYRCAIVSGDS